MSNKEFIAQRINIFAGETVDPSDDKAVEEVLRRKFSIFLPQRRSLNDSLEAATSDHEVVGLILKYRTA